MGYWAVLLSPERLAEEALYARSTYRARGHVARGASTTGASTTGVSTTGASTTGASTTEASAAEASAAGAEGTIGKGDRVVLVATTEPPTIVGTGTVDGWFDSDGPPADVSVRYERRLVEEPAAAPSRAIAAARLDEPGPTVRTLTADQYAALVAGIPAPTPRPTRLEWFVTVALPIEAASPDAAVREFWTYVEKLGPQELPAFVWPRGNELAMQAFVLGEVTNLDPEEDD